MNVGISLADLTEPLRVALTPLWREACAHAGFRPEETRLYPFAGPPEGRRPRATYAAPPHDLAEIAADQYPFTAADRRDTAQHNDLHQIALRVDGSEQEIAATMRHELAHAAEERDQPFAAAAARLLYKAFHDLDESVYRGIYDVLPSERIANTAARAFATEEFGEPSAAVLAGPNRSLFTPPLDPPSRDEFAARVMGLVALLPGSVTKAWQGELPPGVKRTTLCSFFAEHAVGAGSSEAWVKLAKSAAIADLRQRLDGETARASGFPPGPRWQVAQLLLLEAEQLGLQHLS